MGTSVTQTYKEIWERLHLNKCVFVSSSSSSSLSSSAPFSLRWLKWHHTNNKEHMRDFARLLSLALAPTDRQNTLNHADWLSKESLFLFFTSTSTSLSNIDTHYPRALSSNNAHKTQHTGKQNRYQSTKWVKAIREKRREETREWKNDRCRYIRTNAVKAAVATVNNSTVWNEKRKRRRKQSWVSRSHPANLTNQCCAPFLSSLCVCVLEDSRAKVAH